MYLSSPSLVYHRKGNVDLIAGITICITLFIGAKFGAQIANNIPTDLLKKLFGGFIVLVGVKMLLGK